MIYTLSFLLVTLIAWNRICVGSEPPFPLEVFLNISNRRILQPYSRFYLCRSSADSGSGCCKCDPDCMKLKECCADAFWNNSYYSRVGDYIKDFLELSSKYKDQDCEYAVPFFINKGYESVPYYMVTSCEDGTSPDDQRKCSSGSSEALETSIPVFGNDNYLYRNAYCARCNSVKEFELVSLKLGCKEKTQGPNHDECMFSIIVSKERENSIVPCKIEQVIENKSCLRSNIFYDMCRAFIGPMDTYANYYCYLCNHGHTSSTPSVGDPTCNGASHTPSPFSWVSLLQFEDPSAITQTMTCTNQAVFSRLSQKCISFYCPPGYRAVNSKCLKLSKAYNHNTVNTSNFDNCLLMRPNTLFIRNADDPFRVMEDILGEGSKEIIDLQNVSFYNDNQTKIMRIDMVDDATKNYILSERVKITNVLGENGSIVISPTNYHFTSHAMSKFSHFFPDNLLCAKPMILDRNVSFTHKCNVLFNGEIIQRSNLSLWIELKKGVITRNIYACKMFYLTKSCPLRIIKSNVTVHENASLRYQVDGREQMFQVGEYLPHKDGGYGVCIDSVDTQPTNPSWYSSVNSVAGYGSIVASSCSLICYILIILTFLQFKELKNIPGLCASALSINLLVADGLFLTANALYLSAFDDSNIICEIIGVLMHFFLLSAHFWGVVISIDVSCTLMSNNVSRERQGKSKFIKYGLISFTASSAIVITALLLRANGILDVSYGMNGMCVLHGFYSRIILYFVPLIISFLISVVSLTTSICHMSREKRQNDEVLRGSRKENRSVLAIALKLVIIYGLSEGIGIIKVPTKTGGAEEMFIVNSVFGMLYSFAKGFRGVMLFTVYVCRKPVLNMYRKRYGTYPQLENNDCSNRVPMENNLK